MSLTKKIAIALISGLIIGLIISTMKETSYYPVLDKYFVNGLFYVLGEIFVRLLKFMIIPVVVFSLISGITNLSSLTHFAKLGSKVLLLFLGTTIISVSIAIIFAYAFNIGDGYHGLNVDSSFVGKEQVPLTSIIINMIPSNILEPLVNVSMLQVIVLSIIVGVAIISLGKENTSIINNIKLFEKLSLAIVNLIMKYSPYGVFGLIAKVFAQQGFDIAGQVAMYGLVVLLGLLVILLIVQPALILLAGLNPLVYLKKSWEVASIAFSTSSSNATLPITLSVGKSKLGISNTVAGFVIPLGATINMNGTSIMLGAATIFISNIYGIQLSLFDIVGIITLATIAAIGTAGVPGVGIIMLSMILAQYNIPLDGIALILTIDRFLDMCRTVVNVMGDLSVTTFIAKTENSIDLDVYYSK